ncbi:hypothetical protein SEPCBS119000_003467 [Sporothrix epigloea]|uniref:Nucleolar 27S pre-rRNA processing Urb2/Npa2 C-terminal domain-containing protein n=1 Tax=Sporothrix epigloea TaxID=1892477 RepID=A0ABP0DQG8_9PEZI
MPEVALLKAARSLDQSGPETVVSKLQRLWDALVATSATVTTASSSSRIGLQAGRSHAAEEVALRWLLKNMHSAASGPASPEVELLRRWPLTWHILACIFSRIPIFSLAKSLADRRFVTVLQQTAKELATPTPAASGEREQSMRKRKRWQDARFDLASLREPQHCVVSAAALFEALRVLLARLTDRRDAKSSCLPLPFDQMGVEHIKSLFSIPAADATILLAPLLKICRLALFSEEFLDDSANDNVNESEQTRQFEARKGQASWITVLAVVWDLRLQGSNDVFEVANCLAPDGLFMLGRLLNISAGSLSVADSQFGPEQQHCWLVGLKRFFTNNLVLPARSLFLNNKNTAAISIATFNATVGADMGDCVVRALTFLHLALKAPRLLSGNGAFTSKGNELWLTTVFGTIRDPLMSSDIPTQAKISALTGLLDMASENQVTLSNDDLQRVCCEIGAQNDSLKTDWKLLASVARCNADVFLSSDNGKSLLDSILIELKSPDTTSNPSDAQYATSFLISLARGFANDRNISGFLGHWCNALAALDYSGSLKGKQGAWLAKDLRDVVSAALQKSSTEVQFLHMIAEVEKRTGGPSTYLDVGTSSTTSGSVARLVIFDALSASVNREALEDAIQTSMLDSVLGLKLPPQLPPSISAIQWRIIRRTLGWVGFSEAERIWAAVKAPLKSLSAGNSTAKSHPMKSENVFEAFASCFSIWMALKFGGQAEQEACKTTWSFFQRFQQELLSTIKDDSSRQKELLEEIARQLAAGNEIPAPFGGFSELEAAATYLAWMLYGSSRFIDEMAKSSDKPGQFFEALLFWQYQPDTRNGAACTASPLSALYTNNLAALQNQKLTSSIADSQVERLEAAICNNDPGLQSAAQALLQMPSHLFSRTRRERIVSALLPPRPPSGEKAAPFGVTSSVLVLDLLTKAMRERAFGEVEFDRLVYLGEKIHTTVASMASESALGILDRFQQIAKAVFKSYAGKTVCVIPELLPLDSRLLLYAAQLSVFKDASLSTAEAAQILQMKEKLASVVVKHLLAHLDSNKHQNNSDAADDSKENTHSLPMQLILVLDTAMVDDIQPQLVQQKKFASLIKKAKKEADLLCARQQNVGWKWKAFIARYTQGQNDRLSRDIYFRGLFLDDSGQNRITDSLSTNESATLASVLADGDLLRDYLASETANYDQEQLLQYIEEIVNALNESEKQASVVGQHLTIQCLIARLLEMRNAVLDQTTEGFDLGVVHSRLAKRLPQARTVTECRLIAQTLCTLLVDDKAATAMGQWNIDATLCAAMSVVGSTEKNNGTNYAVHESVEAYNSACQLVEAVLKRHRVRLEGRFHLIVSTLQAILNRLVASHQNELKQRAMNQGGVGIESISSVGSTSGVAQAKRFSRLLELICEPSTAAVSLMTQRKGAGAGGAAPLHSATDAAKRSAGQHMYLVLMTYVKLQTDGMSLSVGVRDALEPGFFSILSITPDEMRRLLNGAMDANGQILFKRLYNSWLKGGKWKGV